MKPSTAAKIARAESVGSTLFYFIGKNVSLLELLFVSFEGIYL